MSQTITEIETENLKKLMQTLRSYDTSWGNNNTIRGCSYNDEFDRLQWDTIENIEKLIVMVKIELKKREMKEDG